VTGAAEFSRCGTYRYTLQRTWDTQAPLLAFLMLNPSTADGTTDDPTLRACLRRAQGAGFGRLRVLNIFAFRATRPADLRHAADPVGPDNQTALRDGLDLKVGDRLVCAWGNGGRWLGRGAVVARQLRDGGHKLHYLGLTALGEPRHPLYVPQCQPIQFWGTA
jgi:hypothetical protein